MSRNDERRTANDGGRRESGLANLSIRRYRGIRNLTIDRLAQVTLIAGANGVGKTRLLDATAKLWKTSTMMPTAGASDVRAASRTGPITWITSSDLDPKTRTAWWDNAGLSRQQTEVIDAVRRIAGNIKWITLISPDSDTRLIPVAMTTDHGNPIPLKTLGSGAVRFFEIALALANTRDGLLLIETPDAGVHCTAQNTLWAMILERATRNNVQVLATTHSTDSIYALAEATRTRHDDAAAAYLRLERRDDEVRAVEYTMEAIRVADKQNIAVA